jgi:CHASE2 domain-containing sensor protein
MRSVIRAVTRHPLFPILVALVLAALPVAAYLTRSLDRVELETVDARFAIRGDDARPKDVVLIAVDARSINALGLRPPIDRHWHAKAIDALHGLGARVIAYDFQFTSPTTDAADNALYDAARRAHNVVFSTTFARNGKTNVLGGDQNLRAIGATAGNTGLYVDHDGVIRRFPYAIDGLTSFAVVAARRAGATISGADFKPRGAWIDYAGGVGRVPTVALVDLLRHRVNPALVHGRVAIVGATAPVLQDIHPTPLATTMPGAEIEANAIETALRGFPLRPTTRWLAVLEIVALTLLPALLALLLPRKAAVPAAIAVLLAFIVVSQLVFDAGRIVPVIYSGLGWVIGSAAVIGAGYIQADQERKRLRRLFADFDPQVVEAVLAAGAQADEGVLLDPETVIAGYRIRQPIGRGGMGVVYEATQTSLERDVALKLIRTAFAENPVARERFKRESKLAASIEHPNVIPVYEAGEYEGVLYIAMRLVPGEDLGALVMATGPLQPERAVGLIAQVAAGLDAAHAAGLVHRDVKPANVLVSIDALGDHAYLTDFGLTKRLDTADGLTTPGRFIGTIDYTSPEQIRGGSVSPASDVYSLACVLHYALTGAPPFVSASDADVLAAHLHSDPARLPAGLEPLDAVVRKAMAKDPAERYESAGAFVGAASATLAELDLVAETRANPMTSAAHAPDTTSATQAGIPPPDNIA